MTQRKISRIGLPMMVAVKQPIASPKPDKKWQKRSQTTAFGVPDNVNEESKDVFNEGGDAKSPVLSQKTSISRVSQLPPRSPVAPRSKFFLKQMNPLLVAGFKPSIVATPVPEP
jgi:hypothetical protein